MGIWEAARCGKNKNPTSIAAANGNFEAKKWIAIINKYFTAY